jgi:hypothetical protein
MHRDFLITLYMYHLDCSKYMEMFEMIQDNVESYSCIIFRPYYPYGVAGGVSLTFKSLAVSLRITRFNIQKFYMVIALL